MWKHWRKTHRRMERPLRRLFWEKVGEMMNVEMHDEETTRMVERIIVLRISTKHVNLWIRQLETKRREIGGLAELIGFERVKMEVAKEKPSNDGQGEAPTTSQRR